MKYEFPVINHINDVLPHIKGKGEFIVAERDNYTIIDYVVTQPDTFPDVKVAGGNASMRNERSYAKRVLRECRGLVFDKAGNVMSRRFHKFFNVNEREETLAHRINLSEPHVILEKLDGSMITPLHFDGIIRWGTKMGVTEVSMLAEEFVVDHTNYVKLAEYAHAHGVSPIFEFCSIGNRVVVEYPEPRLVLLAMRNKVTGEYTDYKELLRLAAMFEVEVVKAYPGTVESMDQLVATVRAEKEGEGWIIRFDDGHMLKIKNEMYVRLHKTKERIQFERNLVDIILNNELDDLKPFMMAADLERAIQYEIDFWNAINSYADFVNETAKPQILRGDRKAFASLSNDWDGRLRGLIFCVWDGNDTAKDAILELLGKNMGSNVRFTLFKKLFLSECKWN